EVTAVFETVEPFTRKLAEQGRADAGRRTILKHLGNALLVQHRVSGRVAVAEKPDVVWDRPDLDRLYARLEDEYELKERAEALARKLAVIADTAEVLTDIIDTRRSLRLEIIIVVLIAIELVLARWQMLRGTPGSPGLLSVIPRSRPSRRSARPASAAAIAAPARRPRP